MRTPARYDDTYFDFQGRVKPDGPRFGLVLAWYDLWVGLYWSRESRKLYVLPLPCVGFWVRL